MNKAFSLMEVIIAIVMLSVVMIALLKIKSENIFLVSKSNENTKANEYILLAVDFNDEISNKNEDVFLNKRYTYSNDDVRRELKDIKISIKDDKVESKSIQSDLNNINTTIFSRTYSLENSNIKKKIYSFKIEL
ncbi:MAG: prepilin-type N-terminal cleavage/methylation domain-containing protein [Aliarcobacter sp.]|nr:prepilin-type N-terminal cleavage/methylation domain-containing protein [Aliarcobacter sp.]